MDDITCICSEYDGRGRSVCGAECPFHPVDGACPDCKRSIHGNRQCIDCFVKESEKLRPKSVQYMNDAYDYLIKAFQALERWERLPDSDKSPTVDRDEVKDQIATLRAIWTTTISNQTEENEHHKWYRDYI